MTLGLLADANDFPMFRNSMCLKGTHTVCKKIEIRPGTKA